LDNGWYNNSILTPSVLGFNNEFNLFFQKLTPKNSTKNNLSLVANFSNLSTSFYQYYENNDRVRLYNFSYGFGNEKLAIGFGYNFWKISNPNIDKQNFYTVGFSYRPLKFFAFDYGFSKSLKSNKELNYGAIGIRPFSTDILTLFADGSIIKDRKDWSYGISSNFIDGIKLIASFNSNHFINLGIALELNNFGISTSYKSNSDNYNKLTTFRIGSFHANSILNKIEEKYSNNFVKYDFNNTIKYQKYILFDNSYTLLNLLNEFEKIKNDPTIKGILINTSGLQANREFLWELREKLLELRENGKKILVYIDNANIDIYYFATGADKIIMDPQGMLSITGFAAGRSYYKNMLDKIGLGIDELRFFKYKSAVENYSRDKQSEADSIQRYRMIEVFYNVYKSDITKARNFKPEQWDSLVNKYIYYLPSFALENNLVDKIARWSEIEDEKELFNGKPQFKNISISQNTTTWGKKKKIAIVYAIGACSMDDGITARNLVNDIKAVMTDDNIDAVILRVDSPGGDPLASDLIAEVIRKYKHKKPVIISQGTVAASGGYWLSMYGTKIVASPLTITGSIGVISAWIYDNGLKEKLGITTSKMKIGKFADMNFPFTLPILPIGIPDRALTIEERQQMETGIKIMYKDFVTKVANGRDLDFNYVEPIAQGRIWMGEDAKNIKLVDEIGGLEKSIKIAKELANISSNEEVTIIEMPKERLFNIDIMSFIGFKSYNNLEKYFLLSKLVQEINNKPSTILPLDLYFDYILSN